MAFRADKKLYQRFLHTENAASNRVTHVKEIVFSSQRQQQHETASGPRAHAPASLTTTTDIQQRAQIVLYFLYLNQYSGFPVDKNDWAAATELFRHSASGSDEVLRRRLEQLEQRVYTTYVQLREANALTHHRLITPASLLFNQDKKELIGGRRFFARFSLRLDRTKLFGRYETNPRVEVFPSRHLVDALTTPVLYASASETGATTTELELEFQTPATIDGRHALLRFLLSTEFYPEADPIPDPEGSGAILQHQPMPYRRRRPTAQAFIYLSELLSESRRFRLSLYDNAAPRPAEPRGYLILQVHELRVEAPVQGRFEPEVRAREISLMANITSKYYEFIESHSRPHTKLIRPVHTSRMPCDMYDITLPGAMYLMDALEDQPSLQCLEIALKIHNLSREQFSRLCARQFDSAEKQLRLEFYKAIYVAMRAVNVFSHMCEYSPDVRVVSDSAPPVDVERFLNPFPFGADDCEGLAVLIYVQYTAWTAGRPDLEAQYEHVRWFIRVLRLYVPCCMTVSAFAPSVKSRAGPGVVSAERPLDERTLTDDDIQCHTTAAAIPLPVFRKWLKTGTVRHHGAAVEAEYHIHPQKSEQPWESELVPLILEGTNDTAPVVGPFFALMKDAAETKQRYKHEIAVEEAQRQSLDIQLPHLRRLSFAVPPSEFERDSPVNLSTFYHTAIEVWAPATLFQLGFDFSTLEVLYRPGQDPFNNINKTTSYYGVLMRDFIYNTNAVELVPIFRYTPEELEVCYNTLKQQQPVRFHYHSERAIEQLMAQRLTAADQRRALMAVVDNNLFSSHFYGVKDLQHGQLTDAIRELFWLAKQGEAMVAAAAPFFESDLGEFLRSLKATDDGFASLETLLERHRLDDKREQEILAHTTGYSTAGYTRYFARDWRVFSAAIGRQLLRAFGTQKLERPLLGVRLILMRLGNVQLIELRLYHGGSP
jgi:hypothetical protein